MIGSGIATVAALVAIPVGVALVGGDDSDVVNVATGEGTEVTSEEPSGLAAPADESNTDAASNDAVDATSTPVAPLEAIDDSDGALGRGPFDGLNDENFDLRLDLAGMNFTIEVVSGDDAAARAAEAEAAADETRDIDGQAVWIDERGDEISASAFFDDESSDDPTFVQVTGPAEQVERILDLVTEHANGPVRFFDLDGFADRFDLPEGVFDGEGFPFEDGEFPFGERFPFGEDGPFGEDFPFEEGEFPFEQFFDEGALDDFRSQMQDFAECMDITVDRTGDTTSIEIPDCDFPTVDGLFDGEAFGNLPFDLDRLLEDLPEDMDELFNGFESELESSS